MRLGILHQRSRPGRPEDKGAQERMHRTMKPHAIKPVRASGAARQKNFDAFRSEYNDERPHERLDQQTPGSQELTGRLPYWSPALEYPRHFVFKKINAAGTFRFQDHLLYPVSRQCDGRSTDRTGGYGRWNLGDSLQ